MTTVDEGRSSTRMDLPFLPAWLLVFGIFVGIDALNLSFLLTALASGVLSWTGLLVLSMVTRRMKRRA
jgi:hypothetical protein